MVHKQLPRADVVTNGCSGLCCVAFYVGPPKERWGLTPDGPMLEDMLIPLTNKQAAERLERFGSPIVREKGEPRDEDEGKYFTCRHFDEERRLCRIYRIRPMMCRGYPYGTPCEHGCSCEGRAINGQGMADTAE